MPKRHIQSRVTEEEYKKIRKMAIDLGLTVEEYLRQSAIEKADKHKDEQENKPN